MTDINLIELRSLAHALVDAIEYERAAAWRSQGAHQAHQEATRAREQAQAALASLICPKCASEGVGRMPSLREITLTAEAAAELDRILAEARETPPERVTSSMKEMSAEEFLAQRGSQSPFDPTSLRSAPLPPGEEVSG